jgi:hypothetical protein
MRLDDDGNILDAERFRLSTPGKESEGRNLREIGMAGPDYTIGYADYWETPGHIVIAGYNIRKSGECFGVGTGGTVKRNKATASETAEYENCGNEIRIESAKALTVDNYVFTDLGRSLLRLDQEDRLIYAEITSAADNNTFELKQAQVIVDTGEQFQAEFLADGSIKIETEDPAEISADQETVVTLTGEIDPGRNITGDANRSVWVRAVGKNTVTIDSVLGIVAVHLAETGRYVSYSRGSAAPFSIFALNSTEFDLRLKKHPEQLVGINISACSQCGLYDMPGRRIMLNGMVEYERLVPGTGRLIDVVESMAAGNRLRLEMDKSMDKITTAVFSGSLAHFYSGPFEVKAENGRYYYNFHEYRSIPYIITRIEPNVLISDTGKLEEVWDKASLTLYEKGTALEKTFADV